MLLIVLSVLVACSDADNLSLSERSIIYCSEGSPETFNPQLNTSGTTLDATSNQIYDRLITFQGQSNTITPALAKSWHMTRDGKKITFYLRKDVQFHENDKFKPSRLFNADDVIFSFNRILDKNHPYHYVSGGHYPFFQSIEFSKLVNYVEKINDYTVRFHLRRSDSTFMANLATDFAVILSAEYGQQLTANNTDHEIDFLPIGTGPFKLKEYRVGSLIRYYRHEEYWRGRAHIEHLVYDITPSKTGRLTKLLALECDVSSYPIAHKKITDRTDLLLESVTSHNVGYFGFNTSKPPFDNKLVRQAVSMAINKEALIDNVYSSEAMLAKSILPESSWAYDDTIPTTEYNVDKAKTLLTEAGYPNGFTMDIWAMPVQRAYNPNAITMAKLIQTDLKKIGVKVKVVTYEWTTFLRRLAMSEHQSFLLGWSADHPDPDNFFSPLLSCSATDTGNNRTFWCNKEYDKLIQKALKTSNANKRKMFYKKAMIILNEEIPLLPIAHSRRYQARGINVTGQVLANFGGITFYNVNKKTPENNQKDLMKENNVLLIEKNK